MTANKLKAQRSTDNLQSVVTLEECSNAPGLGGDNTINIKQ